MSRGNAIVVDNDGNAYIAGVFTGVLQTRQKK
jgi:hypothetical protein